MVHLLGVGPSCRGDDGNSAIVRVHPTVAGVSHRTQFHTCHIAQVQVVIAICLDDNILKLWRGFQAAAIYQRILIGTF